MPGQRSISFFGFKFVAPHTRTSLQFLGFCEGYGSRQLVEHVHVLLQPRVVSLHLTANRSTSASPGALTVHLCSSSLTSLLGPWTVGVPTFAQCCRSANALCVAHVSWTCAWVELRRSGGVGVLGCRQLNISPAPSLPEEPLNPLAVPKDKAKIITGTSRGFVEVQARQCRFSLHLKLRSN